MLNLLIIINQLLLKLSGSKDLTIASSFIVSLLHISKIKYMANTSHDISQVSKQIFDVCFILNELFSHKKKDEQIKNIVLPITPKVLVNKTICSSNVKEELNSINTFVERASLNLNLTIVCEICEITIRTIAIIFNNSTPDFRCFFKQLSLAIVFSSL